MKLTDRITTFLSKYGIKKPSENGEVAYLHTYSACKEFTDWAKNNQTVGCSHLKFVFELKEMGFEFVNDRGFRIVIDKEAHSFYQNLIIFVPEIGKLRKKDPWPANASSFLMIK